MSTEARYAPNGEVQGDERPIPDKGGATAGEYSKSLGDASKGDLKNGYCSKKGIPKDTQNDKGFA